MAQNTSSAVMAQRQEARDSLDDFPTQPWGARALVEHVLWDYAPPFIMADQNVWEPACNRGYMARPLREYVKSVYASDVHDYSAEWGGQARVCDFLFPWSEPPRIAAKGIDWIITNPPFRLAEQFIERAFELGPRWGVAMLVRSTFTEGVGRYERLFSVNPPSIIAQFAERLPLVKGRVDPDASTATAYCWLVWIMGVKPQPFRWIPPCRKRLERPGDYDQPEAAE